MFNSRGEEFYGSGIIQNTVPQNLDSVNVLKHERNVTKEPIRVDGKEKVNKIRGDNYYKDYMKEPLNKQNYGKRDDVHFDEAVNYLEPAENQNLDFDGDGNEDLSYGAGLLQGLMGEAAAEVAEEIQEGEDKLEEKSIKEVAKEKPIIEGERVLQGQEKQPTMEGNKDVKLKNTDTTTNKEMKMGDMVSMGAGALAVAMMLMGKNM